MEHVLRCSGYEITDLEIVRAEGCTLHTADGRTLVDFEAGVWAAALGHNHPRVQRALLEQSERIGHIGYRVTNAVQEQAAAEVLRAIGIPDGKCVFLSSGSEAVEFAVQAARRVAGKPMLLTLAESYLSAYGTAGAKCVDEWALFDRTVCARCTEDRSCTVDCPHLAGIPFDRIGAFVFEPGSSGGLVRFPREKLIRALCDAVRACDGLIVVNEITTGVGRTGAWFGFEHYGVRPDVVAVGKGLGGGYPVSAIALQGRVAGVLEGSDFHYAQSHQNDPLGCAVAVEVLRTIRDERLVARSAEVGALFREGLDRLQRAHDVVRDVRGRGLMLAIEFESDRDDFALRDLFGRLLAAGFLVGYKPAGNLLRFLPPLTIAEADIERLLDALDAALSRAAR